MHTIHLRSLALPIAALVALAPLGFAQAPPQAQTFHQAYYLHHEKGDLEAALPLYRRVAGDAKASAAVRAEASRFAAAIAEELACSDFARLVPADTIFYLELNRPGAQLGRLIDQLGLTAGGDRLGISPRLIEGLLGMRGAAFAITDIEPRNGPRNGVAILHPGDLDVVRGLLETALPVAGERVDPIGGHPTFRIEKQVYVTTTSRLVLVSPDPTQIEGVIERLEGRDQTALAGNATLAEAMAMRGDDLLFFCLNLEPIMPMLTEMMRHEARRDPEAQAALALLDLESTRYVAGRAGVGDDGLSLDIAVELEEGHRNIAFNLMRMPPLDDGALDMVPGGAAFFCAAAINHRGSLPAGATDAEGRPVVTALDFGREVFANVADVALYVMPTAQRSPVGPIPDAALALRVNDPARSRALWSFVLGTAQTASGGGQPTTTAVDGEVAIDRYEIEGMPVFVGTDGNHLVISASESTVLKSITARHDGKSIRTDPVFQSTLAAIGENCTQAAALNVGRCGQLAAHFMSDREKREAMPILQMMRDTSMWFRVEQSDRRLSMQGQIVGIPDLGPMVEQLIEQELRGRARSGSRRVGVVESASSQVQLESVFEQLHQSGRRDAARALAAKIHVDAKADPMRLNSLAWKLLTEERFENAYDDLALEMAKTANEAGGWGDWYHLDTYATALFQAGKVDEAITIERKAIEVGADDPRIDEAKAALARFLAARRADKAASSR